MGLVDNDSFLTELTKLFTSTKTSGTVFLTFKKCKFLLIKLTTKYH